MLGVKKTKAKTFVVVDGSTTELIRPALYQAFHNILPVKKVQQKEDGKCQIAPGMHTRL